MIDIWAQTGMEDVNFLLFSRLSSILDGGFQQGKEQYRVRENILNLLLVFK